MTTRWKNWTTKYREKLMTSGVLLLLASIAFLYIDLTKPTIATKSDLNFITRRFVEYSWIKYGRGSSLTFQIEGYHTDFKIKADFFGILNTEKFKALQRGELITIGIPKDKHWNDPCFVYSITSKEETLLAYDKAIKKHNSPFIKIAFGVFAVIALFSIYAGYSGYRRRWQHKKLRSG